MIRSAQILMIGLLLIAIGCGRGPSYDNRVMLELKTLGLEMHNTKPKTQAEFEERSKAAKEILASNNYVYLPGIDMRSKDRYEYIVAYHKDTPTKGGYALDGSGAVELYTKESFATAQKWDPNFKPAEPSTSAETSNEAPQVGDSK